MNSNRRVLLFVIYSVGFFVLASFAGYYYGVTWLPFKRVNLISDVITISPPASPAPVIIAATVDTTHIKDSLAKDSMATAMTRTDFNLYQKGRFVTDFNADTLQSSLDSFSKKLHELKSGVKRKVRIAYFGDSMIEGDLISQTLRKSLQELFGGSGVGFVPITSPVAKFRISAYADCSDSWEEDNFREGKSRLLFLSGHLFHTSNGWVQIRDQSITNDTVKIEKSLLCGAIANPATVKVNNKSFTLQGDKLFNRVVLGADRARSVRLAVTNEKLPLYGISFESESGIFVDNFPFRGVSGIELARIDSAFLCAIAENNPYDLIVIQYGVNLLFKPNETDFAWYGEAMQPVIRKIRNCFPQSSVVVVSTADRAFRYAGEYKSAIGMDSLIKVQAQLAYATGSVFYNQFASMGGANSIVEWAKMKPALANKDYIHPNFRGAEILGRYFFEAIVSDYNKYVQSLDKF
jgi:hypothetical protein